MHRQSEWKRACVRGRVVGGMALGDKRQHAARSKKHGKQQEKSRLERSEERRVGKECRN